MRWNARIVAWQPLVSAAVTLGPVLVLLAFAAAAYVRAWEDYGDEIERHRLEIEKVGWIAANAKRVSATLEATDRALASDSLLGQGETDQAAADLQNEVKGMLDAATLQISSIQPVAESEENGVRFISTRAQAGGNYDKVIAFLRSAQSASPAVLIGAVDVMRDPTQEPTIADAATVRYLVQFEVVRLMAGKP